MGSAMGQEYEGGVDIPLAGDWLFSRFSFLVRDADPYMLNGCANTNVYYKAGEGGLAAAKRFLRTTAAKEASAGHFANTCIFYTKSVSPAIP